MPLLSGPSLPPRSGGAPKQLVLILHGWGADGHNLIDIAEMLADTLPEALFIAPNAPEICEANPYGFQWFSLMDRTPSTLLAGARRAGERLNAYIDETLAALSAPVPVMLVGFSQGTMLSLHVGLRRHPMVKAIVGFSGALIGAEVLGTEITAKPPVCLIHGRMDDVVPYAAMQAAEFALKAQNVSVETHTRPALGHSIDLEGIEIAKGFLQKFT